MRLPCLLVIILSVVTTSSVRAEQMQIWGDPPSTGSAEERPDAEAGEADDGREGLIRITSSPPNAEIRINGNDTGLTPATLAVNPGRHHVVITSPFQRFQTIVDVDVDELIEIDADLDGRGPARSSVGGGRVAPQARDEEAYGEPVEDEDEDEDQEEEGPRDLRWPWAEIHLFAGPTWRSFAMPINPDVDLDYRADAALDSGAYGMIGFRLGAFPFVRSNNRAARGLGLEFEASMSVGLEIRNSSEGVTIDSNSYSGEVLLSYRLVLGRPEAGATILTRFGWHRTNFYLSSQGNDLIPPMIYDALRIEAGLQVPLGTRYFLLEARVAYLPVVGMNERVKDAYNFFGADPDSSNGVDLMLGARLRISRFELGLHWLGRWFTTHHDGRGHGFGDTYWDGMSPRAWGGIESTGPAKDYYQHFRITVGVLL